MIMEWDGKGYWRLSYRVSCPACHSLQQHSCTYIKGINKGLPKQTYHKARIKADIIRTFLIESEREIEQEERKIKEEQEREKLIFNQWLKNI